MDPSNPSNSLGDISVVDPSAFLAKTRPAPPLLDLNQYYSSLLNPTKPNQAG